MASKSASINLTSTDSPDQISDYKNARLFQIIVGVITLTTIIGILGYDFFGQSHASPSVLFYGRVWASYVNARLGPGTGSQDYVVANISQPDIRYICFQVKGGEASENGLENDYWAYLPNWGWVNGMFFTHTGNNQP